MKSDALIEEAPEQASIPESLNLKQPKREEIPSRGSNQEYHCGCLEHRASDTNSRPVGLKALFQGQKVAFPHWLCIAVGTFAEGSSDDFIGYFREP